MKTNLCFSFAPMRRAAVSSMASALFLLAALCAPSAARAAWQPGLLGGSIIKSSSESGVILNEMPESMEPHLAPHVATNFWGSSGPATEPWAMYNTWVYKGQIWLDEATTYTFAESFDDEVWLRIGGIDGTVVLNDVGNNSWTRVTTGTFTCEAAGWHEFELRLYNGTNGAGAVNGNNWGTILYGVGFNKTGNLGTGNTRHLAFSPLVDDGSGSFFRYDDEMGFADYVLVEASREVSNFVSVPPFGWNSGVAPGEEIAASVSPAVYVNEAGNVTTAVIGWETKTFDENDALVDSDSGDGAAFAYTHPEPGAFTAIKWNFVVSNLISVASGAGGSVSSIGGWCEESESMSFVATAAEGYDFYAWAGDVPAESASNDAISLQGDMPRSVVAQFVPLIAGNVQHVAMDGNDMNDGLSFATAKLTIQAAVDELGAGGGTALVAPGVYETSVETVITEAVTVSGATRDAKDVLLSNTVRSGNIQNSRIFNINHADARVEFLTISDGRTAGANSLAGGNIIIGAAGGTVADCVVRNGNSSGNHSQYGGNIAMHSANALVTRCVITNGSAHSAGGGGGIYMTGGRVENSYIAYNTDSGANGSAVRMGGATTLENCTIVRNVGTEGGAVNADNANAVVRNCVIVDNAAPLSTDAAGSVFRTASQASRFINCVADVEINANNFTTTAGFGFVDAAKHDYHLTPLALALDAGAAQTSAAMIDLEGNPREVGAAIDVGCFEYQNNVIGGAFDFAFDADLKRSAAPFETAFTASVVNASGPVVFTWDFGDGASLPNAGSSAAHTYAAPGAYTVTVTADDGVTQIVRKRENFIFVAPSVIHVVAGAANAEFPYDTFAKALPTVAAAVAAADDGTSIIVSNGTHDVSSQLDLSKKIELRGFSGNRDDTILRSPNNNNRIFYINNSGAVVRDITIDNGRVEQSIGGNVQIDPQGGMLTNCVIRGGAANNHNGKGGGIYMRGAAALVTHCVITNNTINSQGANEKGAGVQMVGAARLEHSLIANNRCTAGSDNSAIAGGVFLDTASVVVNCTIAANSSRNQGGVYVKSGGKLINTVIAGNISSENGGDAAVWGNSDAAAAAGFINCATDTAAQINETCVIGTAGQLLMNIAASDFHPAAGSMLIDGGSELASAPAADLDGNARVQGGGIDIGCYEVDTSLFSVTFESDTQEGICPKQITFTAFVGGAEEGDVIKYAWDFDNDSVFDEETYSNTAAFEYEFGGKYTVTLTATNTTAGGASASAERENYITIAPKTIYLVEANENAAFPYNSWAIAATNIHDAVAAALDGCEIIINDGVYNIWDVIEIKRSLYIHSRTDVPESVIINSAGIRNGTYGNPVMYISDPGAWISGLTIQNGKNRNGGANLHMDTLGGTVSNCVIRGGQSFQYEGNGAAAQILGVNSLITHCVITNNHVQLDGSALDKSIIKISAGRLENSLIAGNYGVGTAHLAAVIESNGGVVRNCTITDNSTVTRGVVCFGAANGTFENCVIAGNSPAAKFWTGNDTGVDRIINCTTDEPDLNATCNFASATTIFKNFAAGNYQLGNNSPAIDAGPLVTAAEVALAGIDLAGRPRIIGGHIDNGCYESRGRSTMIIVR